jgi:hypothetical protein
MADYSEIELARAAKLKAVDVSLQGESLHAIADLLRVIPPAAYVHESQAHAERFIENGRHSAGSER